MIGRTCVREGRAVPLAAIRVKSELRHQKNGTTDIPQGEVGLAVRILKYTKPDRLCKHPVNGFLRVPVTNAEKNQKTFANGTGLDSIRNYRYGDVNITVYGAEGQDVNELARIIKEDIRSEMEREEAVYA